MRATGSDADRLAKLLRIDSLKAVYHGASGLLTLKEWRGGDVIPSGGWAGVRERWDLYGGKRADERSTPTARRLILTYGRTGPTAPSRPPTLRSG
ncbi:MAG TPA: hypothetical protein VEK57_04295 [Thermoanaerobaculia bacterium]|nr:hypothetical protein [Thermoanaerobaculia bacterium]